MDINFTTTAVLRPEILDRTYASFSQNMIDINLKSCSCFINIDPVPPGDRASVVDVAKNYFENVIYRTPKKPNCSGAYNWLWTEAFSDIIFNLEDDWILLEEIKCLKIIKDFESHPKLWEIALRAYKYNYNKMVFSPAFFHKRFYKHVAGKFDTNLNHEVQLRGERFKLKFPSGKSQNRIIAFPDQKSHVIVKDIGRKWIADCSYKKPKHKASFTAWVPK